ncbi:hypothetical protein BE08_18630 [Sorangium cellulosum]|uniref:Uncharacterized protein n=1 Tax=Sorangium cellulosum TaxID=56 RepID=A0A150PQ24_SORCE|nr:hypothetical protein BE08_18630 [Sorangium cellulosum]
MPSSIIDRIQAARSCGVLHIGVVAESVRSVGDLARRFGLQGDDGAYREIGEETARRIIAFVLHRDLAYGVEMVPAEDAARLADAFLEQLDGAGCRYFTNGDFGEDPAGASWTPVTSATFDTGALILGTSRSGCLWVEDED